MSEKFLRVDMPDGSKWDVPAKMIAENRAAYYARLDVERGDAADYERAFAREVKYALSDGYEIEDWAANNMNWSDVSEVAVMTTPPAAVDYQEGWVNGEKSVIGR